MNINWLILCASAILSAFPLNLLAADPIKIGLIAESTGPNTAIGGDQVNGARLALEEINKAGGVLGRQIELTIEDNKSINSGSALAFSKLIEKGDIAAVIGPVRSTQILAMMPIISKNNVPVMIGGTDYTLTHADNPWIFRIRPHDGYSAKVIADFGVNQLKRKKWAIVHTAETFGISGKNQLVEALKAFGVKPVIVKSFISNTQDIAPIVHAITQSDIDILATYVTGPINAGAFAKQLGQVKTNFAWIGSPSIASVAAREIAGKALYGTYSVSDFAVDASVEAQEYARKYKAKFGSDPDFYSAWTYDAIHIIGLAIKNANSTKPAAIRKSIFAIQAYKGVEGIYSYDRHGDGLHGFNIVKNEQGKIMFIKHITFQPDEAR